MTEYTTIRLSKATAKALRKAKEYEKESYEDTIKCLLKLKHAKTE